MKKLPTVRWLLHLIVNPGWAPLGVVGLHLVLAEFGLTHRLDHLLHFLGGASISYFLYGFIALLPSHAASIPKWVHYLFAFTSACTMALFWEFAEFGSDRFQGTSIQQSLSETMLDLLFGVFGVTTTLLFLATFRRLFPPCACEERFQDNPANRHQPFRPETNRTSSLGGSRR